MKACRILIALSVLVLSAGALWTSDGSRLLLITPQTESAFFKNYSSQHVIERFQYISPLAQVGPSRSAEAGKDFVTHRFEANWYFAMRSGSQLLLMTSLNDDLYAQLIQNGAQILSRSGDPQTGFHFDYRLANTIGNLTISPLEMNSTIHRTLQLPPGIVDVKARVEFTEKWFPKEQSAIPPAPIRIGSSNDKVDHLPGSLFIIAADRLGLAGDQTESLIVRNFLQGNEISMCPGAPV
jgi:hypothetical protein